MIEFPVLCLDVTQHYQLSAKFHRYVKPQVHPRLTPFCTKLTGIIQVSTLLNSVMITSSDFVLAGHG